MYKNLVAQISKFVILLQLMLRCIHKKQSKCILFAQQIIN